MENEWVKMNSRKIKALQYRLTEISYKNEYQDIPIRDISGLLNAALNEIRILTEKNEKLNIELQEERNKNKTV